MNKISTLIFDLDGTLSDPSVGIYRCMNFALSAYGYAEVSKETVAAEIGPPLDEAFGRFQPGADKATIEGLVAKYRERYASLGYSENQLYPGVAELLAGLVQAKVRVGVCTSKRKDFAEKILAMFGLLDSFSFVSGGDIGIQKREQLAELLHAGKIDASAVMIGDRAVDILAAKANGLRSVGVLWGFGSLDELQNAGADVIVSQVGELASLEFAQAAHDS